MKSLLCSGGARRQLSFSNLPYKGKSFYLDVKNSSLKTRLSRRILDLGGQIENFLSKDVDLLITDKNEEKGSSKTGLQAFACKQNLPLSRGQALLLQASKNQSASHGQTNDILQNAANLGVKMETATAFFRDSTKLLSKLKADKKTEKMDAMLGMAPLSWDGKDKENTLVIKVEDSERLYRPLFKQFDDIPKVGYNDTGCPFDVGVVLVKQSDNQSTKKKSVGGALRGGYCESCDHWYRCTLREHLSSNKHKEFVSKLGNFKNLEEVANDLPSFDKFLKQNTPAGMSQVNSSQDLNVFQNCSDPNNNSPQEVPANSKLNVYTNSEKSLKPNISEEALLSGKVVDFHAFMTENSTKHFMHKGKTNLIGTSNCIRNSTDSDIRQINSGIKSELHMEDHGSKGIVKTERKHDDLDRLVQPHDKTCSGKSDVCISDSHDTKAGASVVPDTIPFIPEANFSSSSRSFGENGVKNALTFLQSENSRSSRSRNSAGMFSKIPNGAGTDQSRENNAADLIDKSEISLASRISGLIPDPLDTPTFGNFLKAKDKDLTDNFDMPELFPVEQMTETDIENGTCIMPVIDKHTPPSHNNTHLNAVDLEKVIESVNIDRLGIDASLDKQMDTETMLHTPKFDRNLSKELNDRVKNSGSTVTSVRNWLLPNEDNHSGGSAFSVSKLNSTVVPLGNECETDSGNLHVKQLTNCEHEHKQSSFVASWIQSQEFGNSSHNHISGSFETELKIMPNIETPNEEFIFQDNLSSRDITTPISEMYNDHTDLSSIPTDSVISDNASLQTGSVLDNFDGKISNTKENLITCTTEKMEPCVKENDLSNSTSNQNKTKVNTESDFLHSPSESVRLLENKNPDVHIMCASSITSCISEAEAFSQKNIEIPDSSHLKSRKIIEKMSEKNLTEKVSRELTVESMTSSAQNEFTREIKQNSSVTMNPENTTSKKTNVKKKQVKPKVRKTQNRKAKINGSVEKCFTPVSTISNDSATVFPHSASVSLNITPKHPIQYQMYSPISQSSDHFMHQTYNLEGFQLQNQTYMYQQSAYGSGQQCMTTQNQLQNYYSTGILPGQNFYSEERHAFYQNQGDIQSQHYGFSGLSDINAGGVQSPHRYQNSAFSYSQNNYLQSNVGHANAVNFNNFYQDSVPSFKGLNHVDFLEDPHLSPASSHNGSISSSVSFCPVQNVPVSSHSSHQYPYIQDSGQISAHCNNQTSQQFYSSNQHNSSHHSQLSQTQSFFSPVSQVAQGTSQNVHWYLSSPGYTAQNNNQVSDCGARSFETISLNDIAEDTGSISSMYFSLGKFKSKEDQKLCNKQINSNSNSQNQETAVKQKDKTKIVHESYVNCDNATAYSQTASNANVHSPRHDSIDCERAAVPPSVQPLRPSSAYSQVAVHEKQHNYIDYGESVHEDKSCSSIKSYVSAKVGDTKIKISKLGAHTSEKKTDLKDYWNVKKTGDCRLVFRMNKRKAEDESSGSGSNCFAPYTYIENYSREHPFENFPQAKKRRCDVY